MGGGREWVAGRVAAARVQEGAHAWWQRAARGVVKVVESGVREPALRARLRLAAPWGASEGKCVSQ